LRVKVLIHQAEEGGYWAEVPGLRGCYSQGETKKEVLANIQEAVTGWLEVASEQAHADAQTQVAEIEV
jgi:predicted RNase H-like HicB family nuclease